MKRLMIIGAGGHGKVIADIALKNGYREIAFLDDNPEVRECAGFPVLGTAEDAAKYTGHDFFIAIGNPLFRRALHEKIKDYPIVTLIHPNAVVSRRVEIGRGTAVMAGAVINSDTVLGEGCIVNTCASVDHDNVIGDYVHISIGAHLGGTVSVGDHTWIGAGAVVSNNVGICADCMIGAGGVVVRDIEVAGTYIGVPAVKRS